MRAEAASFGNSGAGQSIFVAVCKTAHLASYQRLCSRSRAHLDRPTLRGVQPTPSFVNLGAYRRIRRVFYGQAPLRYVMAGAVVRSWLVAAARSEGGAAASSPRLVSRQAPAPGVSKSLTVVRGLPS